MRMRMEREKNVIIFGIEETLEIDSIVKDVTAPNTVKIINTTRLGKPAEYRERPVEVELLNSQDVVAVLRNKSKVPKHLFPNIKISSDKTPLQIQELKALHKELDEKKKTAEGKYNYAIKYINNIPKIVTISDERKKSNGENLPCETKRKSTEQRIIIWRVQKTSGTGCSTQNPILEHACLQK
ncbi:hypothetical protein JTB14_017882 [Gonioctena quinquepunctata]|nr:hypothetical protein JTB14_017882 [Gonioctena quinquepunctata]